MAYNQNNPNGQATGANSAPVVMASDQASTISDGTGVNGLGTSLVATNFVAGTGNTSTSQLTASSTFTGTVETIFNQQAISILLTSDQSGTLILNQYIDVSGLRKAASFTFTITAGVGFSRSFVANGNYFNLTFQNNGGATTTTLNINTFYGTLPASTNWGNLPVSLDELNGTAIATGDGVPGAGVQRVVLAKDQPTFRGRVQTFRTPGRAGTVGQKIFALHNATGSTKVVRINQITVDLVATVVKLVTVLPPTIRIHRFTAVPTSGTSLTKVAKDTALSSNASITAWGDASADGTSSGTALAVTIPAGSMLTQEFAARLITAAGYEPFDRESFLDSADVVLRPLEGIVLFLDYVLATQNPITDMWIVGCDWDEV